MIDSATLMEAKHLADELHHNGEFGEIYIHAEQHRVICVFGEGDEITEGDIEAFDEINLEIDISAGICPNVNEGWLLISHGVEVIAPWFYSKQEFHSQPLSIENYARFYFLWDTLK